MDDVIKEDNKTHFYKEYIHDDKDNPDEEYFNKKRSMNKDNTSKDNREYSQKEHSQKEHSQKEHSQKEHSQDDSIAKIYEKIFPDTDTFPLKIKRAVKEALDGYKPGLLREHQYIVNQYMSGKLTRRRPRGILLYHLMGTGKTVQMISSALTIGRPVICIMSKSLLTNFQNGLKKFSKKVNKNFDDKFTYISLDAYNMLDQLHKKVGTSLDGYTIVVDEAHELFSQMINPTNKNAPKLYNMIMVAQDINLIFATGTPIVKDPFEIVPCFNMLAGKNLLPTSYDDFNSLFLKDSVIFDDTALDQANANPVVKNAEKLQNRLFGMVSHVINNPALFPRKLPVIIERVNMAVKQLTAYRIAREAEILEDAKNATRKRATASTGMGRTVSKTTSTYRQKSRALCNLYYDKENDKVISPKLDKLVENIEKSEGKGIAYSQFKESGVYAMAERLIGEGWVNIRGNVKVIGSGEEIEEDNPDKDTPDKLDEDTPDEDNTDEDTPEEPDEDVLEEDNNISLSYKYKDYVRGKSSKTFAILDGDVPVEVRSDIIKTYNSPDNLDGQRLRMLLVTTVGSRGINLIACKHTHYFEPYWYLYRLLQFETRAIRDGSHLMLPKEEQTVQSYIYLSTIPYKRDEEVKLIIKRVADAKEEARNESESTDETLYNRSLVRQYILDYFLELLKEISIECPFINQIAHLDGVANIKCKTCAPLGNKLYSDNIYRDIEEESPCKQLIEKEVETHIINIDNVEYRYTRENEDAEQSIFGIAIYKHDDLIGNFVRISESNPIFNTVFNEILKL